MFVLCSLLLNNVYSQQSTGSRAPNFYEIKKEKDAYFENIRRTLGQQALDEESSEYQSYKRWCNFWEPRLAPSGDFANYMAAEDAWTKNYMATHSQSNRANVDPWNEIGPTQKPQGGLSSIGGGERGVGIIRFCDIYEPGSDNMLCGSPAGGLFFSTDAGVTWTNSGSDTKWGRAGCTSATFSINDLNTCYAATCIGAGNDWPFAPWLGSTGGIMRTTDHGSTWDQIGANSTFGGIWASIQKVIADPNNASVLFVVGSNGIFKTSNATATPASSVTWTQVYSSGLAYDIEFKPGSSSILYATAQPGGTWQILTSTNSGVTWGAMTGQPANSGNNRLTIEVTPANANYVYMLFSGGSSLPFYRFDASAGTWSLRSSVLSPIMGGGNGLGVSRFNANEIYAGDGIYYSRSTDGGLTWTNNTGGYQFHVDIEYFACSPTTSTDVWMCTHGGVSKTSNSGTAWSNMGVGLGVSEIQGMSTSYTDPGYVGIGLYHDGTLLTTTSYTSGWTPNWSTIYGGDGFKPIIDYTNPAVIYASPQGNSYQISTNYGSSFSSAGWPGGEWYSYAEFNSSDPTIAYGNCYQNPGKGDVWRHERNTTNDAYISDFSAAPYSLTGTWTCWRMYDAPSNPNYLYLMMHQVDASSVDHIRIYRTTQATAAPSVVKPSWVEITSPIPGQWLTDITIDMLNPEIVYYTFSGYASTSGNMVFKADYTTSTTFPTITNLSYNLPQTQVSSLVQEKGSNGAIYVATDFGVYYINNEFIANTTYWHSLGTGLPNVNVNDGLEINYEINRIRVGTFGRGVWEHDLYCPGNYDQTLSGTHTGTLYFEAEHDISSTATVSSTANVTYRAGNRITLSPNFRANNGSYFHAFIHPCSHSGNSFRESDELAYSDEAIQNYGREEEEKDGNELLIYPNPANGVFMVDLKESDGDGILEIRDVLGNCIKKMPVQKNALHYEFDLSEYGKGIYILNYTTEDQMITKKVIIK